jgi:thiol-disulfide isomerase/thioredoxin
MPFVELASPNELTEFLNDNSIALLTFSATWCGPCKASKKQLQEMAKNATIPFGYVYESDLEDFLDIFIEIRAFPTYVLFKDSQEVDRIEGVDLAGVEAMIKKHTSS